MYPPLVDLELAVLAACQARGAYYFLVSGLRDLAEQDAKYAQGRTAPGKIITNARGGFSAHNYGTAADHARDKDLVAVGLQPEWSDPAAYAILKEEGERVGLQVGVPSVPGGDPGHVQLPFKRLLKRSEKSVLLELRGLYLEGKTQRDSLKRVWARLDALGFNGNLRP